MRHDYGYDEETLGKTYDFRLLKRLFPLARPYRHLLGLSIFLVMLITAADLALPFIIKETIDRYIVPVANRGETAADRFLEIDSTSPDARATAARHPDLFHSTGKQTRMAYENLARRTPSEISSLRENDLQGVFYAALLLLGLAVASFGINFIQVQVMEYTGQMMMHDLRCRLYGHMQGLRISFFNRNPVGRLVTRVTNDIGNMHELFTSAMVFVFKDLFLLAGIAGIMLVINWRLALVTFAVLPLVAWASFLFSSRARGAYRTIRVKIAEINAHFAESVGGIAVIQAFGQERANYQRFKKTNHENYLAEMQQIHLFAVFMPLIELMAHTTIALIIFYGGQHIIRGHLSLGALVAFISYMRMFFRPVRDMAEKYNLLQNAMASAERIFLVLDNDETVPTAGRQVAPASGNTISRKNPVETIAFDDVSFAYVPGEHVLKKISMTIRAGETIAVVGPTGSGKTSLVRLLLRFFDPQEGQIRINGIDVRHIPLETLRSKMAMVMQEPFLFSETIEKNIFPGPSTLSKNRVREILESSNCQTLVDRLPEGLQTVLAEGGASISSGERQLLCIARALAKNPEIIILDEATSYVDAESEHRIQAAMANLMQRRTAIVVAHRLATARRADRIFVLHRGRIIETGTHSQLMQQGGFYQKLYLFQTGSGMPRKTAPKAT
jgi:ATP-binding cassette, subfamily B, multidrug efflux pump